MKRSHSTPSFQHQGGDIPPMSPVLLRNRIAVQSMRKSVSTQAIAEMAAMPVPSNPIEEMGFMHATLSTMIDCAAAYAYETKGFPQRLIDADAEDEDARGLASCMATPGEAADKRDGISRGLRRSFVEDDQAIVERLNSMRLRRRRRETEK